MTSEIQRDGRPSLTARLSPGAGTRIMPKVGTAVRLAPKVEERHDTPSQKLKIGEDERLDSLRKSVNDLSQDVRNMASLDHVSKAISGLTRYMDEISLNVAQETAHRRLEVEQLSTSINDNLSKAAGVLTQELNSFSGQLASLKTSQLSTIRNDIADINYRLGQQELACNEFRAYLQKNGNSAVKQAASAAFPQAPLESMIDPSPVAALDCGIRLEDLAEKQRTFQEDLEAMHRFRLASEAATAKLQAQLAEVDLQKAEANAEVAAMDAQVQLLSKSTKDGLEKFALDAEQMQAKQDLLAGLCDAFKADFAAARASVDELQSKDEATRELLEIQYQRLNTRITDISASRGSGCDSELEAKLELLQSESSNAISNLRTDIKLEVSASEQRLEDVLLDKIGTLAGLERDRGAKVIETFDSLAAKVEANSNSISFLQTSHVNMNDDMQSLRSLAQDKVLQNLNDLESAQNAQGELLQSFQELKSQIENKLSNGCFVDNLDSRLQELIDQFCSLKHDVLLNSQKITQVQEDSIASIKSMDEKLSSGCFAEHLGALAGELSSLKQDVNENSQKMDQVQEKIIASARSTENKFDSSLDQLHARLQELHGQVSSLKHDMNENSQKVEQVQEASVARLQELFGQLSSLNQDVNKNSQKIDQVQENVVTSARGTGHKLDSSVEQLRARLQELHGQLSSLKSDVDENSQQVDQVQESSIASVQEVLGQLSSLKQDVNENSQKIGQVQENVIASARSTENKVDSSVNQLHARLQELNGQVSNLKSDLHDNSLKVAQIQDNNIANVRGTENKFDSSVEQLHARWQELAGQFSNLKFGVDENSQNIAQVQETSYVGLQELIDQCRSLRFDVDENSQKVARVQETSAACSQELSSHLSNLKQDVNKTSQKVDQVQENIIASARSTEDKFDSSVDQLHARLQELHGQVSSLKSDLHENSLKVAQIQDNTIANVRGTENKFDSSVEQLHSRLQELSGQYTSLKSDVDENSQKMAQAQETGIAGLQGLQELISKVSSLKRDVDENSQKVAKAEENAASNVLSRENQFSRRIEELIGQCSSLQLDVNDNCQKVAQVQESIAFIQEMQERGAEIAQCAKELSDKIETGYFTASIDTRLQQLAGQANEDKKMYLLELTRLEERMRNALMQNIASQKGKGTDDHIASLAAIQHSLDEFRSETGQAILTMQQDILASADQCTQLGSAFESDLVAAEKRMQSVLQESIAQTVQNIGNDMKELRLNVFTEDRIRNSVITVVEAMMQNKIGDLSMLTQEGTGKLKVTEHLRMLHAKADAFQNEVAVFRTEKIAHEQAQNKLSEISQEMATELGTLREAVSENARKLGVNQESNLKSSIALSRRMDQIATQSISRRESDTSRLDTLESKQFSHLSERLEALSIEQMHMKAAVNDLQNKEAATTKEVVARAVAVRTKALSTSTEDVRRSAGYVTPPPYTRSAEYAQRSMADQFQASPISSGVYATSSSITDRQPQRLHIASSAVLHSSEVNDTKKNDSVFSWLF